MIGSIDPPSSTASFKPVLPEDPPSVALDATPDGGSSVPAATVSQATTGPVLTARRLGSDPPTGTARLGSLSSTPVDAATTCMNTRELRWHAEQHARAARAHALHAHHPSDFAARMQSRPVTSRRSQRALPLSSRGLPLTGHSRSTIDRTPAAQTHRAHRVATDPLLRTHRQPLPPFSDPARSCHQPGRRRNKQQRDPGPRPGCLVSILDNKNSYAGRCDLTGRFVMWLDCTKMDKKAPENWAAARHNRKKAVPGRPMSHCASRPCTPQYRSSSPKRSSH